MLEWSNVNALDMTITVMSFENGRLNPAFSNMYAAKFIGDMDKDGVEELLIFTGNRGTVSPAAMLVEGISDGSLVVSSDCLMCPDVYESFSYTHLDVYKRQPLNSAMPLEKKPK